MSMKGKFLLVTLIVFALDHLTKYLVSVSPSLHRGVDIIPGFFSLSYVLNSGVAFGIFQESQSAWKPYLLSGLAVLAVVVIAIYSSRMPSDRLLLQLALAVTMGGILGNFTDRILRGSVVDFIELHIKDSFHWPTFNIADSAITIGIALLMVDALRHPDRGVSAGKADPLP
jgi:signal peptidase II